MNPFEFWYQLWKWWAETLFEVRVLRDLHNINVKRLDSIEKQLR
jgi:hypothetical protein